MVVLNYAEDKEKIRSFINEYYENKDDIKVFTYKNQMIKLYEKEQVSIRVHLDHVKEYDEELCFAIERNCVRYQKLLYEAIDEIIFQSGTIVLADAYDILLDHRLRMERRIRSGQLDENLPSQGQLTLEQIRERFPMELLRRYEAYFVARNDCKVMSIRELRSDSIGRLVKLKAIVSSATQKKPICKVAAYTCDRCGGETFQEILNQSYMPLLTCKSESCLRDGPSAAGKLHKLIRGSKNVPVQELKLQELPDQVTVGGTPSRINVTCIGENTDHAMPGDPVSVTGIVLPALKLAKHSLAHGLVTDHYIEVHNIEIISKDDFCDATNMSPPTEEEIDRLRDPEMYEIMARSIAPEIYGHEDIKKALLIMMARGSSVAVKGLKVRGELNICLMGDPGVAKSQLLSFIDRLSPRSQYTNGKGTSGVGLTASVTRDPLTNEFMLEGGSLVLADGGICCIDEFDKMNDMDRTYIHEVMEQQTISIAKAGIHTKLNARVAILAAANPAYGRYNPKRTIEQNIDLSAALLSRFDLMWLILDRPERSTDLRLAQHVTHVHMTNKAPENRDQFSGLSMMELRRYLAIVRMQPDPVVPSNLVEYLTGAYVSLCREARISTKSDSLFTSPRNLLGLIRISTALARLHARTEVERADIDEALRLCENSKASIRSIQNERERKQHHSPKDVIYDTVRRMAREREGSVRIGDLVERCLSLGFTSAQVEQVLNEYEELNVWMINIGRTQITML